MRVVAERACTVDIVTDYQAFLDLEPVWNRLAEQSGTADPFITYEWVRTWWDCFGHGVLWILVVKLGGEPIAIAPFMWTTERRYGLKLRCVQLLANDHTPRGDFLVAAHPELAYYAIWECLLRQSALWDLVQLREVPADSPTLEHLPKLARNRGFLWGVWHSDDSPFVPLGSDWNGYVASLPAKHRSNLRNRFGRLSALGSVEFETVSSGPALQAALEDGFRLEGAAWKTQAQSAIGSHAAVQRFYTLLAERAAARGWLRLQFLKVNGRRIAFAYALAYRDRVYLVKPGYDPAYAAYSPGNLLCYHAVREACGAGVTVYDFLGRDEDWKRQWARHIRSHYWLFVFPDRRWARLVRYAKFELLPSLQQRPLYLQLRDRLFSKAPRS